MKTPRPNVPVTLTLRAATLLALAAGLLLAAGLTGCTGDSGASGEPQAPASGAPSTTLRSMPDGDTGDGAHVPIEAGSYRIPSSAWSVADFTVTFPEGWNLWYSHIFGKNPDGNDEVSFYAVVVDEVYADACHGEGVPMDVGPAVEDLVTALGEQPGLRVSDPVDTMLGDYPATRIDLQVSHRLDLTKCRLAEVGVSGLQVWYSEPADKYFVLEANWRASVYILDVAGERQVFLTQQGPGTSEADMAELREVLDSMRIEA